MFDLIKFFKEKEPIERKELILESVFFIKLKEYVYNKYYN